MERERERKGKWNRKSDDTAINSIVVRVFPSKIFPSTTLSLLAKDEEEVKQKLRLLAKAEACNRAISTVPLSSPFLTKEIVEDQHKTLP
jgi:hypothetical protein